MTDESIQRATDRLLELGVSRAGAGQLLSGETVTDGADRATIAGAVSQLLGGLATPLDVSASSAEGLESDPGTSKVKTRILGTNYDG